MFWSVNSTSSLSNHCSSCSSMYWMVHKSSRCLFAATQTGLSLGAGLLFVPLFAFSFFCDFCGWCFAQNFLCALNFTEAWYSPHEHVLCLSLFWTPGHAKSYGIPLGKFLTDLGKMSLLSAIVTKRGVNRPLPMSFQAAISQGTEV